MKNSKSQLKQNRASGIVFALAFGISICLVSAAEAGTEITPAGNSAGSKQEQMRRDRERRLDRYSAREALQTEMIRPLATAQTPGSLAVGRRLSAQQALMQQQAMRQPTSPLAPTAQPTFQPAALEAEPEAAGAAGFLDALFGAAEEKPEQTLSERLAGRQEAIRIKRSRLRQKTHYGIVNE